MQPQNNQINEYSLCYCVFLVYLGVSLLLRPKEMGFQYSLVIFFFFFFLLSFLYVSAKRL